MSFVVVAIWAMGLQNMVSTMTSLPFSRSCENCEGEKGMGLLSARKWAVEMKIDDLFPTDCDSVHNSTLKLLMVDTKSLLLARSSVNCWSIFRLDMRVMRNHDGSNMSCHLSKSLMVFSRHSLRDRANVPLCKRPFFLITLSIEI